jgi:hypothetical protein
MLFHKPVDAFLPHPGAISNSEKRLDCSTDQLKDIKNLAICDNEFSVFFGVFSPHLMSCLYHGTQVKQGVLASKVLGNTHGGF